MKKINDGTTVFNFRVDNLLHYYMRREAFEKNTTMTSIVIESLQKRYKTYYVSELNKENQLENDVRI